MNLLAFCLKKGANLLVQLAIVTWDTLIPELIIKNWEIALVDELFKKYSVNAVSITCSGKRIPFIEREPLTNSLEAVSILVVWCFTIMWLHFLLLHL